MTKQEAEEILAVIRRGELFLDVTDHFRARVKQRVPGFSTQHLYQVIRRGSLQGEPVPDPEFNNHKIKVRGPATDFGKVEIVLGISWFNGVCVTIYEIERREV